MKNPINGIESRQRPGGDGCPDKERNPINGIEST
jgi:hypothetical protein